MLTTLEEYDEIIESEINEMESYLDNCKEFSLMELRQQALRKLNYSYDLCSRLEEIENKK